MNATQNPIDLIINEADSIGTIDNEILNLLIVDQNEIQSKNFKSIKSAGNKKRPRSKGRERIKNNLTKRLTAQNTRLFSPPPFRTGKFNNTNVFEERSNIIN